MSRVVEHGGARVDLAQLDPLASGGEASVYAVGVRALKIWHAPTPARVRKLDALLARRTALPPTVVAPSEPVRDATGAVVGFAMPLLAASYEPIAVLGRSAQRAARGLSNRVALDLLGHLLNALRGLHRAGVVVGDLSDQNVAIDAGASEPLRLLDVDSFQVDGLPCEVATEAFLDPHLYGPDVARPWMTADGSARTFSAGSDHYAFAVLLFRALTGAHPYGGVFAPLPTLARRALARASVLRDEVTAPPRVRDAIEVLGAPLRARFEAIFERGDRTAWSAQELAEHAAALVACGCGLEIPASALPCPRCAKRAVAAVAAPLGSGLRAAVVLEAAGPIVAIAACGDAILAVAIEGALPFLHVARAGKTERFVLCRDAAPSGWDVALGTGAVAVAPRGAGPIAPLHVAAVSARGPSALLSTTTDRAFGVAAVAVAHETVFRVARGMVLAGRAVGASLEERPVATVMRGGARLFGATSGETPAAVVVGAALGVPRWEVVTLRGTTPLDAPDFAAGEVTREVAAYGDAEGVTVLARTSVGGRPLVRLARFDVPGRRVAARVIPADARLAEDVVSGGAARSGAVVLATAGGLVREDASGAERRFSQTSAFTAASAPVALARGGVLVADGRVVRLLELS